MIAQLKKVKGHLSGDYFCIVLNLGVEEYEGQYPFEIILQMPDCHYSHLKNPEKMLSTIVKKINKGVDNG